MFFASIKILIVDDNPDDVFIATRYIKKGFSGVTLTIDDAGSFSALETRLDVSAYDLFLIDYHLGEYTGLEVMKKIRTRGIQSPMILLTGQGDEVVAVTAMKEGAWDYLKKKTLSVDVLCNTIRHAMEFARAEVLRKKTEKSLKESEEKYRTMINTTTEGFWLLDLNFKTLDLNESLCKMLQYTRKEILSSPAETLITEEKRIAFKGALESIIVHGEKVFETILKPKNAHSIHAIFNATSIRNRMGVPVKIFAFVTDISKMKEAEETLKKSNKALKVIDQMKSDFLSYASHELRTPLTSIRNAVSILEKGKAGPFNKTQERFIKIASRNIDRLANLVNDVLDLSKIEAGKLEIKPSELALGALMENVTALFQSQALERGTQFELEIAQNLPSVYADSDRIEQVLCNLLSNALKFTPKGGRVLLSAQTEGEWVTVCVSDTGPGLSPEDQTRVFDRFYQVGDVLNKSIQGTGLGLSIAKELVERHGGRISVVSESGQGCCFFFSLPVCSGRAIDMAALENAIRPYKKGSMFSLVLLVFDPEIFSHRDGSPSDSYDHILDLVLKALQRDSDLFIAQPSFARIVCLLPGTSSLNAVTVRERLTQYFSLSPLSIQDIKIPIPMIMNPVSYPQDGETGKELIEKALLTVAQH